MAISFFLWNETLSSATTNVTGSVLLTGLVILGIGFLVMSLIKLDLTTKLGLMFLVVAGMAYSVLGIISVIALVLVLLIMFVIYIFIREKVIQ